MKSPPQSSRLPRLAIINKYIVSKNKIHRHFSLLTAISLTHSHSLFALSNSRSFPNSSEVIKMASHIGGVNPRALQLLPPQKHPLLLPLHFHLHLLGLGLGVDERTTTTSRLRLLRVRVSDADDSYLHMWKNAADKERKSIDFQNIALNNSPPPPPPPIDHEDLEKKTVEFQKILQVSKEERDRIQRMQVIDRAAAAIAAARAILNENASTPETASDVFQDFNTEIDATATGLGARQQGKLDSLCIPHLFFGIYCEDFYDC